MQYIPGEIGQFYCVLPAGNGIWHCHLALPKNDPLEWKKIELLRGTIRPSGPLPVKLEGRKKTDFLRAFGYTYVTRKDVLDLFRSKGLTGWEPFPVKFRGRKPDDSDYFYLIVCGKAGRITSKDIEEPTVFDAKHWDGSDVFQPEGTTCSCLSKRARDVVVSAGLSGFRFDDLVGQ